MRMRARLSVDGCGRFTAADRLSERNSSADALKDD